MTEKDLSLREAAKLLQFAPQTVKKMIARGELKASSTGKGKKRRYTIAAKDMPKANASGERVRAKRAKWAERRPVAAKKAKVQVTPTVGRFVSKEFPLAAELSPAEHLLRTTFLNWCSEKLLGA